MRLVPFGRWYPYFVASDKLCSGKSPLKIAKARAPQRGTPDKTKVDVSQGRANHEVQTVN